jgi:hypothetical protein
MRVSFLLVEEEDLKLGANGAGKFCVGGFEKVLQENLTERTVGSDQKGNVGSKRGGCGGVPQ